MSQVQEFVKTINALRLSPDARVRAELDDSKMTLIMSSGWPPDVASDSSTRVTVTLDVQRPDVCETFPRSMQAFHWNFDAPLSSPIRLKKYVPAGQIEHSLEPGRAQAISLVKHMWLELWSHELEEWIRLGGTYLYDPHQTGRTRA